MKSSSKGTNHRASDERIGVLVWIPESVLRTGLMATLDEDLRFSPVEPGSSTNDIEALVAECKPRVVLVGESVDYRSLARLKARRSGPAILAVAHNPSLLTGTSLLGAGISCISSNALQAEILDAVHLSAEGQSAFFAPDTPIQNLASAPRFTKREVEVFVHLAAGRPYKYVADKLEISVRTVASHSERIRHKVGVRTKQDLVGLSVPTIPC